MQAKNDLFQPLSYSNAVFETAQSRTANMSRAFSHLSEGMAAAAKAQAALVSEVFKSEPNLWLKPVSRENAASVTHEWLASHKARQEKVLHGIREINDTLMACFFSVADELIDCMDVNKNEPETSGAKVEHIKVTSAAEKKSAAA
ncbi:hypothetical protein SAMN02746095_00785 [Acidocella aminolytica 101 = DSM 11237]|jgi:hypothetical protein|nr:hypothetical protein SAMN02746095_00785 [Acidocella aminolytica 101 = DSM 11237]